MTNLIDNLASWWLRWRTTENFNRLPADQRASFKSIESNERGTQILLTAPAVVILATEAAALLDSQNAKNYVEFDMMPSVARAMRPIRVTVAWANGEAPSAKAERLEKLLENEKSDNELLRKLCLKAEAELRELKQ